MNKLILLYQSLKHKLWQRGPPRPNVEAKAGSYAANDSLGLNLPDENAHST